MNQANVTLTQADTSSVPPGEISRVLETLWRDSVGEDAEASVIQVRTLNLLVIIPQALAHAGLFRAIDAIAVQHPGRIITMVVAPDAQPPRAQVAIACRFGDDGKHLCGEQVTITCGDGGAPLPSIAASLQLAGVPTFLWWVGDPPFASEIFHSFVDTVDRVLVDSRTWHEPLVELISLAGAVAQHSYIAFTDLQWTALTPWRRQTAQCFDVPAAQPYLARLSEVHITYGAGEAGHVAALLLIGWLASCLGWHYRADAGPARTFNASVGTVTVHLSAATGDRVIQRITLHGEGATFTLVDQPDTGCLRTEITLPDTADINRITRFTTQPLEQSMSAELNMIDRDPMFEAALSVAAELTGHKRSPQLEA